MIRYSRPKVIILIIITAVLWYCVRCGISLPFSDVNRFSIDADGSSVEINNRMEGSLAVTVSDDELIRIMDSSGEKVLSEGSYHTQEASDVIHISIPSSYKDISIAAIDGISADGIEAERIFLSAVSGNISAENIRAREIDASTVSGNITVSQSAAAEKADAGSVSGNILLALDEAGEISADTVSGNITVDVPQPEAYSTDITSIEGSRQTEGHGSGMIRLNTASGTVNII